MAHIESIKGILAPCDILGVTRRTALSIDAAVNKEGLFGVIKRDSAWNRGVIAINTHLALEDEITVMDFVNKLTEVINANGIKELDLDGALTVAIDEEPYEFKMVVRLGKVFYQQG